MKGLCEERRQGGGDVKGKEGKGEMEFRERVLRSFVERQGSGVEWVMRLIMK